MTGQGQPHPEPPDVPPRRRAALERGLWLALAVVLVAVIAAGTSSWLRRRGPRLPVLGEVPPFELVERSGRTFRAEELRGAPWVADFIFTRCSGICPVLSSTMSRLQAELDQRGEPGVRLVSHQPAFAARMTRPGHISFGAGPHGFEVREQAALGAETPNGNSVSLEDQMMRAAAVKPEHDLALGVYAKSLAILRATVTRR